VGRGYGHNHQDFPRRNPSRRPACRCSSDTLDTTRSRRRLPRYAWTIVAR
jgi:hypothetical protein